MYRKLILWYYKMVCGRIWPGSHIFGIQKER